MPIFAAYYRPNKVNKHDDTQAYITRMTQTINIQGRQIFEDLAHNYVET